ncbi:flavodoxin family protein [Draconibacterium sp. IB214405]|uniref:flavodoxin family protein n=1 Tax=Draconibacterium sp. IB214405 TaxID=3097352 RepID=UPI002A13FA16|nr:flavodoxin family protein [Draconibacterium sp. IB214405]MDX8341292.1 flavodoxin family protein [Draconibacterium sp. IB214405]
MEKKIVILNGDPEKDSTPINNEVQKLAEYLLAEGAETYVFNIRELEVKHCVGCFDCWLKSPGICRFNDDVETVLREIIKADLLIFASPLIMGMYSALLKRFQDRMIPIIHPYLEIVNNECHHKKRYASYPDLGFIYCANDANEEEIENIKFIHKRIALNIHAELLLFESVEQNILKEMSHEISHF